MKALLLVENKVEDAFAFSRTLKATEPECEFYTVATIEAAKRYLAAGASDPACVPAAVVVSPNFAQRDAADLIDWMGARAHLHQCKAITRADANPAPAPSQNGRQHQEWPVTALELAQLFAPGFPADELANK